MRLRKGRIRVKRLVRWAISNRLSSFVRRVITRDRVINFLALVILVIIGGGAYINERPGPPPWAKPEVHVPVVMPSQLKMILEFPELANYIEERSSWVDVLWFGILQDETSGGMTFMVVVQVPTAPGSVTSEDVAAMVEDVWYSVEQAIEQNPGLFNGQTVFFLYSAIHPTTGDPYQLGLLACPLEDVLDGRRMQEICTTYAGEAPLNLRYYVWPGRGPENNISGSAEEPVLK